jgi:hypothetical protein
MGIADPVVFLRVGRVETAAADEGCRRVAGSGDCFADEVDVDIAISCI